MFGIEEHGKTVRMPFEQSLTERLENYQSLGASNDGSSWERLASWKVADFDAGPLARVGSKRDGAALWVFGTSGEGASMKARAARLQSPGFTRNIDLDYFVQRMSAFKYNGEGWMVGIGLKRGSSGQGREQFVILSNGRETFDSGAGGQNPDPRALDPKNASEAFALMPSGTKISLCALSDYADEIGEGGQILTGQVGAVAYFPDLKHATLPDYDYKSLYPFALWLRVDAAVPLQMATGAAITSAIRAELAQFDQLAPLDGKRTLAIAASKRVEAVLLLAPSWSLDSKVLKVRG